MNSDTGEFIFCADDDEYRVFCEICDKLCIEWVYKNQLETGTHNTNILNRQQKNIINTSKWNWKVICFCQLIFFQINMDYYCGECDETINFILKTSWISYPYSIWKIYSKESYYWKTKLLRHRQDI